MEWDGSDAPSQNISILEKLNIFPFNPHFFFVSCQKFRVSGRIFVYNSEFTHRLLSCMIPEHFSPDIQISNEKYL